MKIGFIGLGQMGRGMAVRLLELGHQLTVWNRTPAPATSLAAHGASVAKEPASALDADVVITMLADDAALDAVWVAPALMRQLPAGAVHLNMASVSLAMGERLARLHHECSARYVAAPVFGRPQAAASGALDIIAAGPREALSRCEPVFAALGRQWFDLGEAPAHANAVKIARNFLLGAIVESLGEAFALMQKCGVDRSRFLEIITTTSMNAPAYKNYGRLMIEAPESATFTLKLGLKDVEVALEAARDKNMDLPLAALMREHHLEAIARGYGDKDWAALGNYIAERAGV